jgi:RNA polymerase sigma-70 factor (ECF subfamily)
MRLGPKLRALLDSSDLVQQTMLKAWARRDQFGGQTTAEYLGWLRRILAHEAYDQAKREGLIGDDPAHMLSLEQALDESGTQLDAALALDSDRPPARVIQRESLVALEKALGQLPKRQLRVVQLHKLQGQSLADTAREMGLTKPAVAGLYARALKTLRRLLAEPE